jgi:hypothetical protein
MSDDITRAIVAAERFADALRLVYDKDTLRHLSATKAFQNRMRHYGIPLVLVRGEPIREVKENED